MFEATADAFADDAVGFEEPRRAKSRRPAAEAAAEAAYEPSHYTAKSNRKLILLVIAGHALALWAAIQFDVVGHRHHHHRLQVELVPMDVAPPPKMQPPQQKVEVKVQTPIVSPTPIVQMPIAPPPTVESAPVPTPPAPPAVTAPAAPVVSAPVVPPDGFAANLGNTPPSYPMASRRAHEEGTVRLRVLISAAGTVEEVSLAKSSGFDALDDAALRAVRKWHFRPGTQAGTPVEAVGFLSIPFKLTRS